LPGDARAQEAAAGEEHPVGDFILRRSANGLQISHRSKPDRFIWETAPGGNFIIAENAATDIKDFGTPEAFFTFTDTVCIVETRRIRSHCFQRSWPCDTDAFVSPFQSIFARAEPPRANRTWISV
jgi:hypothetical protein